MHDPLSTPLFRTSKCSMLHFSQGNGVSMYENFWSAMYLTFAHPSASASARAKIDDTILSPFIPLPSWWGRRQRGRGRDTLFNREVKLLWSFILAKWTTSKRFDVTMVHPIKRTHVKIAVSARYTDCLYVSSSINLSLPFPSGSTHTHARAVDSLLELVIYLLPPPPSPLLNRHVNSSFFRVPRKSTARRRSARLPRPVPPVSEVRRFPIFAHVFIRLTIRERGQSWSGEARINEPRKAPSLLQTSLLHPRPLPFLPLPPSPCSNSATIHEGFRIRYDCALRPHSMAGQEEQVMVFAAINVWLTKGNSRFTMPPPRGTSVHPWKRKVGRGEKSFEGARIFAEPRIIEFSIFQRPSGILLTFLSPHLPGGELIGKIERKGACPRNVSRKMGRSLAWFRSSSPQNFPRPFFLSTDGFLADIFSASPRKDEVKLNYKRRRFEGLMDFLGMWEYRGGEKEKDREKRGRVKKKEEISYCFSMIDRIFRYLASIIEELLFVVRDEAR